MAKPYKGPTPNGSVCRTLPVFSYFFLHGQVKGVPQLMLICGPTCTDAPQLFPLPHGPCILLSYPGRLCSLCAAIGLQLLRWRQYLVPTLPGLHSNRDSPRPPGVGEDRVLPVSVSTCCGIHAPLNDCGLLGLLGPCSTLPDMATSGAKSREGSNRNRGFYSNLSTAAT